jgi:hypothetical protein
MGAIDDVGECFFIGESVAKENSNGGGMTTAFRLLVGPRTRAGGELECREEPFSGDSPLGSLNVECKVMF